MISDLGSGSVEDRIGDKFACGDENKPEWRHISGKFVAINLVTVSCRCSLSPLGMSPFTHIGDGCMDLILVHDCSRTDYLRHLIRIPNRNANQVRILQNTLARLKCGKPPKNQC